MTEKKDYKIDTQWREMEHAGRKRPDRRRDILEPRLQDTYKTLI
jgi:hypothetical protein